MKNNYQVVGFINLKSKTSTVFWATIIAGILDALAAIIAYAIYFKYNPVQIYQFVSSAILGNEAYSGGIPVAMLGLIFHFLIAFVSSYLFIQFYPKLSILRSDKIIVGMIYGLVIWSFMNFIVMPLTKLPRSGFELIDFIAILWHMFLVGLPISVLANFFYKTKAGINC